MPNIVCKSHIIILFFYSRAQVSSNTIWEEVGEAFLFEEDIFPQFWNFPNSPGAIQIFSILSVILFTRFLAFMYISLASKSFGCLSFCQVPGGKTLDFGLNIIPSEQSSVYSILFSLSASVSSFSFVQLGHWTGSSLDENFSLQL